jgi:hypothetical protein
MVTDCVGQTGSVRGHVLDSETGDAVFGAHVISMNTPRGAAVNNLEGEFLLDSLATGNDTLMIYSVGYGSECRVIDVISDKEVNIRICMRSTQRWDEPDAFIKPIIRPENSLLTGRVTNSQNEHGIEGATIYLTNKSIDSVGAGTGLFGWGTATDSSGFYKAGNIPPGYYTMSIYIGSSIGALREIMVLRDTTLVMDFQVSTVPDDDTLNTALDVNITGRVWDCRKVAPFAGVTVKLFDLDEKTITDEQGVYVFKGISRGRHILRINAEGYHTAWSKIELGKANWAGVADVVLYESSDDYCQDK